MNADKILNYTIIAVIVIYSGFHLTLFLMSGSSNYAVLIGETIAGTIPFIVMWLIARIILKKITSWNKKRTSIVS